MTWKPFDYAAYYKPRDLSIQKVIVCDVEIYVG